MINLLKPLANCFLVLYTLEGLRWLSKLDIFRAHLSGAGLINWDVRCRVQALHSRGRSWDLYNCGSPGHGEVHGKIVAPQLLLFIFT